MKRTFAILLLACLVLAGCAKQTSEAPKESAPPTPSVEATPTPEPEPVESPVIYIPTGTWVDDDHPETSLVIDDKCAGSVSVLYEDGAVTVWTFSGEYDPETGSITYSDCVRQDYAADVTMTTAYTDGTGSLTILDGYLYWNDDADNAGAGYRYRLAS